MQHIDRAPSLHSLYQKFGVLEHWTTAHGRLATFVALCVTSSVTTLLIGRPPDEAASVPVGAGLLKLLGLDAITLLVVYLSCIVAFLLAVTSADGLLERVKTFFLLLAAFLLGFALVVGKSAAVFWALLIPLALVALVMFATRGVQQAFALVTSLTVFVTLGEPWLFDFATPLFAFTSVRQMQDVRLSLFLGILCLMMLLAFISAVKDVVRRPAPSLASENKPWAEWTVDVWLATLSSLVRKFGAFADVFARDFIRLGRCLVSGQFGVTTARAAAYMGLALSFASQVKHAARLLEIHVQSPGLFSAARGAPEILVRLTTLAVLLFVALVFAFVFRHVVRGRADPSRALPDQYSWFILAVIGSTAVASALAWLMSFFGANLPGFAQGMPALPLAVVLLLVGALVRLAVTKSGGPASRPTAAERIEALRERWGSSTPPPKAPSGSERGRKLGVIDPA